MAPKRRTVMAATLGMLPLRHAMAQGAGPGGFPARLMSPCVSTWPGCIPR